MKEALDDVIKDTTKLLCEYIQEEIKSKEAARIEALPPLIESLHVLQSLNTI